MGFSGVGARIADCVGGALCDVDWVVARGPEGVEAGVCDGREGMLGVPFWL